MNSVSINQSQNAINKRPKIHLSRPKIAQKIMAFQELISLSHNQKSGREASNILEVPNSTMQSWQAQWTRDKTNQLAEFLATPVGADFLQRNVLAVMKLMKCGSSGIRGMQEYLCHSGLDKFVASSDGALQNFWERCETYIVKFGEDEEKKLALNMKSKKITVGLDEMFRGKRPCLVAIEVVSNYILVEKFTEDRKTETWKKEIEERLNSLDVEINQVVSDLCGSIRACAKELQAEHIPELFHAQNEISRATAAPLASQERSAEKALAETEEELKKANAKPRWLNIEKRKEQLIEIENIINCREQLQMEFEKKKTRRETVKAAVKEIGRIHHPINLQSGKLQSADIIEQKFGEQFKIIEEQIKEAKLLETSKERIEKAKRAFKAIMSYLKYFFIMYLAFIRALNLEAKQELFFKEVIFSLSYLRMIWKRLPKKEKEKLTDLMTKLEGHARDGPWSEELKLGWMKKGKELAETFQRSSSCVEGRNGVLSLNHHRFHRLGSRSLKVLTIVHNYDIRRTDGTTAAERFLSQSMRISLSL